MALIRDSLRARRSSMAASKPLARALSISFAFAASRLTRSDSNADAIFDKALFLVDVDALAKIFAAFEAAIPMPSI